MRLPRHEVTLLMGLLFAGCLQSGGGLVASEGYRGDQGATEESSTADSLDADTPPRWRVGTAQRSALLRSNLRLGHLRLDTFEPRVSRQFEGKARAIARAILAMDVDFVLLQEIESDACMSELKARLGARYPLSYLGEIGTPASPDVGILGKGELLEVITHRDTPIERSDGRMTTFTRELPEVHILFEEQHFILLPLHFRSKFNDDPERRLAEARAAREITLQAAIEHPSAIVVLGGDVNDGINSPALAALEADALLDSVHDDLPQHKRWTHTYENTQNMLDHLLLAVDAKGHWVLGETRVVREDAIGSWPSDHAALVGTIASE